MSILTSPRVLVLFLLTLVVLTGCPSRDESDEEDANQTIEIELGAFSVKRCNKDFQNPLCIDFKLYGQIRDRQQREFCTQLARHLRRYEAMVGATVRGASDEALREPDWATLRKQIREKSNAMLGEEFLLAIVVGELEIVPFVYVAPVAKVEPPHLEAGETTEGTAG